MDYSPAATARADDAHAGRAFVAAAMPERFAGSADDASQLFRRFAGEKPRLFADRALFDKIAEHTLRGDPLADAYAGLLPKFGYRRLAAMLSQACAQGVEAVEDAPPELVAWMRAMETFPDWLDRGKVGWGNWIERNIVVHRFPYFARAINIAARINKYSSLPMTLAKASSDEAAARRIAANVRYFMLMVMPDALDRRGAAFQHTAFTRFIHAVSRCNAVRAKAAWDPKVFGTPIPQVDMFISTFMRVYLLSLRVLKEGRREFRPGQAARVELHRYFAQLLGLSRDLLPDHPQAIVDTMHMCLATLRKGYDEAICGEPIRTMISTRLYKERTLSNLLFDGMERGFSKVVVVQVFFDGDRAAAARAGVRLRLVDWLGAAAAQAQMEALTRAYQFALDHKRLRPLAEARLVRKLQAQLEFFSAA